MPSKENRRYSPTRWQIPLGPPSWDELTRFALDQAVEGERASEVVATLLVLQWRPLHLRGLASSGHSATFSVMTRDATVRVTPTGSAQQADSPRFEAAYSHPCSSPDSSQ